jgi:membrane protease YdiL (CAAX protease family)
VFLCEVVSGISVFGVVFSVRARSCAGLGFFSSPCLSLLYLNTTRLLPAFGALIAWNTMSNLFLSKPGAIY